MYKDEFYEKKVRKREMIQKEKGRDNRKRETFIEMER